MVQIVPLILVGRLLLIALVWCVWAQASLAQDKPPNRPSHWPALVPDPPKRSALDAQGIKPMEGEQIKGLYVGNTIYYTMLAPMFGLKRGAMRAVHFRDSKTGLALGLNGRTRLEMVYWIEGDALCNEWPDRTGRGCYLLYPLPDRFYTCSQVEDICRAMVHFAPGNPEKL